MGMSQVQLSMFRDSPLSNLLQVNRCGISLQKSELYTSFSLMASYCYFFGAVLILMSANLQTGPQLALV